MLIVFQIPVADSRAFLPEDTNRLWKPTWPSPAVNKEFIRFLGNIKLREAGGLNGWIGENLICESRKAIHFSHKIVFVDSQSSIRIPFKVAFRHFFFDGNAVGKLEIGFICPTKDNQREIKDTLTKKQFKELVQYLFSLHLEIYNPLEQTYTGCELIKVGKFFARLYLFATTIRNYQHGILDPSKNWYIESGTPTVLLKFREGMSYEFPFYKKEVDFGDLNFDSAYYTEHKKPQVFSSLITYQGSTYPMWVLEGDNAETAKVGFYCNLRHLRICLLRLYTEHQCLRIILKNIESGRIEIIRGSEQSEQLQYYLNEATRRINKLESPNIDITEMAREIQDYVFPGERESLVKYLEKTQVRKNICRKVDDYFKKCYSITIGTMQGDIGFMEGDTINAGAGATVINRSLVEKSFNRVRDEFDEDTASALRLIAQEIEKSGNKEAGELFDSFNEELQKPEPKRSLLRTLWNGMVEALPTIGQLAGVVAQISKLFIAA